MHSIRKKIIFFSLPEEFNGMTGYLQVPLKDENFRRQLESEGRLIRNQEEWGSKVEDERRQKEEVQAREVQTIFNLSKQFSPDQIAEITTILLEKILHVPSRQ